MSPPIVSAPIIETPIVEPPIAKPPIISAPPPEPRKADPGIHTTSPVQSFLEARLERAVPITQDPDDAPSGRAWRAPDFRRVYSAGKLLFQVVGVAGFAGYFVSMHTLMRVFSGMLLAGTWYAIYKVKGPS